MTDRRVGAWSCYLFAALSLVLPVALLLQGRRFATTVPPETAP